MQWIYITLAVIAYLFVGFFTAGFAGVDPFDELPIFIIAVLCWPIMYFLIVLVIVAAVPIKIGKKLCEKYGDVIQDFFNNFFD